MELNEVRIVGNLTKDPEIRHTVNGTAVVNASLGVNEAYTVDGQKKQSVSFLEIQVWGAAAENLNKLAKKGQQLFVSGALKQDVWEKDGQSHSKTYVRADNWQFTQYRMSEAQREAAKAKQQQQEVAR